MKEEKYKSTTSIKPRLIVAVLVAAALWFLMFSPWVHLDLNFWWMMTGSAVILISMAMVFGKDWRTAFRIENSVGQILLGIAIAAVLWGVFWVGDKLSQMMFGFARPQVDSIYGMKAGLPSWLIALLLLFVIGPAEELFWRGYVQRTLAQWKTPVWGFVAGTLVYALIHIWALNFMLLMAALVCGVVWGALYWWKPKWLPALVLSHALWDAFVFVILPI